MEIGKKLKDLRRIKNLTQEELAERTDLSKGYISQIESGHASPSMESFLNILEVLGTLPGQFFQDNNDEKVLYKKAEQKTYDEYDKGYLLTWPVTRSNEFEMEPLILTLKGSSSYKNFKPSPSDTFIYCLKGEISLMLGDKTFHATKGDALYFKANQIHKLFNPTMSEARVMVVATASYL
ncbi:XRE family transcriptional regulator [Staphylococcus sp. ACRSN]|uniref:helix-turn-helix domain-containing protein n=1 Tax=Staphylococcus sp. ACRSN TaxID=2918214 RepID=UPI001EF330AC|nr:XRE family transcriptional regulator [Staphylococcus sp. ACRSN]MCG7338783.1 XRE family transcriptional regulator [Staphylococcus sp. ACRSN]